MIPKFRCWDHETKTMFDVKGINYNLRVVYGLNTEGIERTKNLFPYKDYPVMQSTGLFDKNGQEIFEGDVVKTTRFNGRCDDVGGYYEYEEEYKGIVRQLEGCWVIDTGKETIELWSEMEENEIIGHKYMPEFEGVFE